jgi:hypothetical protein
MRGVAPERKMLGIGFAVEARPGCCCFIAPARAASGLHESNLSRPDSPERRSPVRHPAELPQLLSSRGVSRLSRRFCVPGNAPHRPSIPAFFPDSIPPGTKSDAATMEREFRRTMHFPLHQ